MSVPILDASAWRIFRGPPSNFGLNKTTHKADVADAEGKLHRCYVKLMPDNGSPGLLCEAIGWLLARSSHLAYPAFGAILLVPVDKLRECMTLPAEFDSKDVCAAWCSEVVPGKTLILHSKPFLFGGKDFLKSSDAPKIAAFDQWCDLRDRNYGNVIVSAKGRYVVIDHETLLHESLWVPTGEAYEERSILENAKGKLAAADMDRFKGHMVNAAKGHGPALQDAAADLADIIVQLYPTDGEARGNSIRQTLDVRSQTDWLSTKLGIIS